MERFAWWELTDKFTDGEYERRVSLERARSFVSRIRKEKAETEGKLLMRRQKLEAEKLRRL